jgi:hypothetical protein
MAGRKIYTKDQHGAQFYFRGRVLAQVACVVPMFCSYWALIGPVVYVVRHCRRHGDWRALQS